MQTRHTAIGVMLKNAKQTPAAARCKTTRGRTGRLLFGSGAFNAKVSDGSQPPVTLYSSLSESAGSRSLHRLVRPWLLVSWWPAESAYLPSQNGGDHLAFSQS